MQPAQKIPFSYSLCYWLASEWTGLGVVCTSMLLFFKWEDGKDGSYGCVVILQGRSYCNTEDFCSQLRFSSLKLCIQKWALGHRCCLNPRPSVSITTHMWFQQRSQLEVQVGATLVEMWTSTKTPPAAGQPLTFWSLDWCTEVLREKSWVEGVAFPEQ